MLRIEPGQSRSLLGVLRGYTQVCWGIRSLNISFEPIKNSQSQEAPTSKADYIWLVDDDPKGLCEPVKSPSVMKAVADSLPAHGIKLTWASCQSLLPKILAKVMCYFLSATSLALKEMCVGRTMSGFAQDGMAFSYLPQLLDCGPSRER